MAIDINGDRAVQMAMRILAVLATRETATIGEVLDIVARDDVSDEREFALLMLGALNARKGIAFVDEYHRDVPLRSLRVRRVPLDGPWSGGG